jgi:hypothetical protein
MSENMYVPSQIENTTPFLSTKYLFIHVVLNHKLTTSQLVFTESLENLHSLSFFSLLLKFTIFVHSGLASALITAYDYKQVILFLNT